MTSALHAHGQVVEHNVNFLMLAHGPSQLQVDRFQFAAGPVCVAVEHEEKLGNLSIVGPEAHAQLNLPTLSLCVPEHAPRTFSVLSPEDYPTLPAKLPLLPHLRSSMCTAQCCLSRGCLRGLR